MPINVDIVSEIDEAFAIPCHECNLLEECGELMHNLNGLKVLTLNIRSINRNFDSFLIALERLAITFDIIILTECGLQCSPLVGQIPGYDVFQTENNLNRCGGITVYTLKCRSASAQKLQISEAECLSIEVSLVGTILAVYRSPSFLNKATFLDSLSSALKFFEKSGTLILAGDLNINILDQSDQDVSQYLNILAESNMLPAITRPIRINSCIDHIFVRTQAAETVGIVGHTDITDHSICMLDISL